MEDAASSQFQALVQELESGAQLLDSLPLTGGVSARVTALEVRWTGGQTERLVVREYGARDLQANPEIAQQEFELLRVFNIAGLPVPLPRHAESGLLVTDFVNGETDFHPVDRAGFVCQMAAFLARLHALPSADFLFLRALAAPSPYLKSPDESLSESRIRDALEQFGLPPLSAPAALHGDFWPGNLLWQDGRLAAVIDWEDAALGDPLADVGNARLELLFFMGLEAMNAFTLEYGRWTGVNLTHLPCWDLRAALRPCGRLGDWGLEAELERQMRQRHREFVDGSLERL